MLDAGFGVGLEGDGLFVMGEVVGAHGGDVGFGVGRPLAHAVGVGFGELFDGLGGAAVGVAFAEDGVDGGSHHFGVAGLGFFFFVGGGFVYEVGDGVALGLELGDAIFLGNACAVTRPAAFLRWEVHV